MALRNGGCFCANGTHFSGYQFVSVVYVPQSFHIAVRWPVLISLW